MNEQDRFFLMRRAQALTRVRARIVRRWNGAPWLARLPWPVWCLVGATNAKAVARALGQRSSRPLFVLQVGANDGVSGDPLYSTIRENAWVGLFVEPVPSVFERLRENYADQPGLAFENAAIAEADGEATIYTVADGPQDRRALDTIASLDEGALLRNRRTIPDIDALDQKRAGTGTHSVDFGRAPWCEPDRHLAHRHGGL